MTTLYDMTLELAKILMKVRSSFATSDGAAGKTTLIDSARTEPDDYFFLSGVGGGTIWFTSGTNDGVSRAITNWSLSTKTFTFAALVSAKTVTNDTYMVAPLAFPRDQLMEAINQAYKSIGNVPAVDETKLTVADQVIYALPTGVYNVKKVAIAHSTTSPYGFVPHYMWKERNGYLHFREGSQPQTTDYPIRIEYAVPPSELTADSSTVSNYVHPDLLKWAAAVYACRTRRADARFVDLLQEAVMREEEMRARWPIPELLPDPQYAEWSL